MNGNDKLQTCYFLFQVLEYGLFLSVLCPVISWYCNPGQGTPRPITQCPALSRPHHPYKTRRLHVFVWREKIRLIYHFLGVKRRESISEALPTTCSWLLAATWLDDAATPRSQCSLLLNIFISKENNQAGASYLPEWMRRGGTPRHTRF